MAKKLVILGAGIGGLSAVRELRQCGALGSGHLETTIVDQDFAHFLGFTLPWVMRGWKTSDQCVLMAGQKLIRDVRTVTGTVRAIDSQRKHVLGDHFDISYDALIIALGARNNPASVPGLADAINAGVAHHYYSIPDAEKAHHALSGFRGGNVVVLIPAVPYRCPPAPYEGALLIGDYLNEHGKRAETRIDIFTVEPQPMPSAGTAPGQELMKILADADIGFHPNMRCQSVDAASQTIHFDDGATAKFDLLLFVPPHEPALGVDGPPAWIPVDPHTLATGKDGVWAIGDITSITTPSGAPLPKAAVMAKGHARTAVNNALQYLGLGLAAGNANFNGHGYCFIDTGNHRAARGIGDFYALPTPNVELEQPSTELRQLKDQEEIDWISQYCS